MPASFYPNGFLNGVVVRGLPLTLLFPGQVWWVDNDQTSSRFMPGQKTGSDSNNGDFLHPFATLAKAISMCASGRGDIIVIKPYHAENINDNFSFNLNKANTCIFGLGNGVSRPTFTMAPLATFNITNASCCVMSIDLVTSGSAGNGAVNAFTCASARGLILKDLWLSEANTTCYFQCLINGTSGDNFISRCNIEDCRMFAHNGSTTFSLIRGNGGLTNLYLINNYFMSLTTDYSLPLIRYINSGAWLADSMIKNNSWFSQGNAANTNPILLDAAVLNNVATRVTIKDNTIFNLATNPTLCSTIGGLNMFNNYYNYTPGKSGKLVPVADT